ncbi:ABC transporter substrate-binding protein [Herbiconiux sp. A18JL235]|uniref:ABC transporter substrate-binding protein n=1 Tax=Herbiconiux sp. A18JL235 TaxID=3152363 RepID=A0AB39BIC1_9MICO
MFRGLTWDHPRGWAPLRAAAELEPGGPLIEWSIQPLEGFEAAPIDDLAEQYDVIVIDHPHLGEAVASGALLPLDELLGDRLTATLAPDDFVGPSWKSYTFQGHLYALPLDAATQTAVSNSELVEASGLPRTWQEVVEFARDTPTALGLGGPHALITLYSIALSFGAEPGPRGELDQDAVEQALALMTRIAGDRPELASLNSIRLLDLMASGAGPHYCPLVYQFVTYTDPRAPHRLRFSDAPAGPGGRRGSVIGGTGLAVSARCTPSAALLDHLLRLVSDEVQRGVIPARSGQPARLSAWTDPALDATTDRFYAGTLETITGSWLRPRHTGFPALQNRVSAVVRDACTAATPIGVAAADIVALLAADPSPAPAHHTRKDPS